MTLTTFNDPAAVHVTCCANDNLALCAENVADHEWTDDPTTCAPCSHLEHTDYCPRYIECRLPRALRNDPPRPAEEVMP